jgi:N,N'-diacetyllegionaminate synthase
MNKTIIIAEAGVNHNGDLDTAKNLIEVAAESGADYVKFQTFKTDELVTPGANQAKYQKLNTGRDENQYEMLKRLELNYDHYEILIRHASSYGIKFISTAFDVGSLNFLQNFGLDMIKIPSGEITNLPYLLAVAEFKKPIVMSTGMSSLGEIEAALEVLYRRGIDFKHLTLLHCTSEYPAPMDEVNLRVMGTLQTAFGVKVGYSDHTMGIEIPIAAVAMGATLIEKHFTLDREMDGPDHKASINPKELKKMVSAIRSIEKALGDGVKRVTPSELRNISVARKSIVAKCFIKKGSVFTNENLSIKRPGTGISPMKYEDVLGKIAIRDFDVDQLIEL